MTVATKDEIHPLKLSSLYFMYDVSFVFDSVKYFLIFHTISEDDLFHPHLLLQFKICKIIVIFLSVYVSAPHTQNYPQMLDFISFSFKLKSRIYPGRRLFWQAFRVFLSPSKQLVRSNLPSNYPRPLPFSIVFTEGTYSPVGTLESWYKAKIILNKLYMIRAGFSTTHKTAPKFWTSLVFPSNFSPESIQGAAYSDKPFVFSWVLPSSWWGVIYPLIIHDHFHFL
jgi:hypothetical protein